MKQKTMTGPSGTAAHPDLDVLRPRVPAALLQSIRRHAAFGAMTIDDFVRDAIEERLLRSRGLDDDR